MKPLNPCAPRRMFRTEQAAKAASAQIASKYKVMRYAVPCGKCNGWHLS